MEMYFRPVISDGYRGVCLRNQIMQTLWVPGAIFSDTVGCHERTRNQIERIATKSTETDASGSCVKVQSGLLAVEVFWPLR